MKFAVAVVALLAVCVVGVLVAGWLETSNPVDTQPDQDDVRDAWTSPEEAATPDDNVTATDTTDTPEADVDRPLVPRILPPDAALEDVRDALVARDADAVRKAYERITRMSRSNASFGTAMKRLARDESDKRVVLIVQRASVTPWAELTDAQREEVLAALK